MPGVVIPNRRSRSTLDDDSDSVGDSDRHPSSNDIQRPDTQNKRTRLSDEDGRRDTRDSWHLDTPQTVSLAARPHSRSVAHSQRDSGVSSRNGETRTPLNHHPGSIVRITLTDFVTYSSATFHLGPALNMIIGPNGTGKSTLVCAICLGLGWSTQHLGRAREVHEFVKHDRSEAVIEIELKGRAGERNPVIKRQINKDNSSKWWLDGHVTNQKNVSALARSFDIQIDNLCQFLPQDRVVEFAALSPVERLTQTVRATAPEQMVERHNELKDLRVKQKALELDQANTRDNLANLEGRQNTQQADVERFRERERILQDVDVLEKLRPLADFNIAKIRSQQAKEKDSAAKQALKRLKAELQPSLRAVNSKQEYAEKVKEVVDRRKTLFTSMERQADDFQKKNVQLSEKINECEQKREAEKRSNKSDKTRIIELQRKIQSIKVALENEPPSFDPAEFNERKRDKTRQVRDILSRIQELDENSRNLTSEANQKKQRKAAAEKEASDLRSRVGQQMSILKSQFSETYKAWEWISQNQDQFESQVYGPAIVECSVKDERFVNSIETLFQKTEFCAITCTNDNDMKKLSTQLYETMKLADISLRNHKTPLANYRAPVSDQEKQGLGITGWALDYVAGPDTVLSMLCAERTRLHSTAVIERDVGDEQYGRLEQSVIENWVTPTTGYKIIRRKEYGAASTTVTQVREARVWKEQQVDPRHEGDLRHNIDGWESELADLETKIQSNKQEREQLRQQENQLKTEEANIEKEKADLQKKTSEFRALPNKLETQEAHLSSMQAAEKALAQRLEQITAEESKFALEKGQAAINCGSIVEALRNMHVQLVEATIAHIEASSDVDTLKSRNTAVRDQLTRSEKEVQDFTRDYKAKHDEARRLGAEMTATMQRNPDVRDRIEQLSDEEKHRTPEEINLAIEGLNARLILIHGGNAGIIKEFEERAKKIDTLRNTLATVEENLARLCTQIIEIRSSWEPELDALVAQISDAFSASFEKINCAGEVVVHKAGEGGRDFESWAMNIRVKFREHEELSVLDSHRQSGGERAVSTIFYLMALQSRSRAPFRVVDEINQGMDPRNERIVHERMVDIACGMQPSDDVDNEQDVSGHQQHGSQYFLITPKLLTNLKYSPDMKVHCIASGLFMPPSPSQLDFKMLVSKARQLVNSQSSARIVPGLSGTPSTLLV